LSKLLPAHLAWISQALVCFTCEDQTSNWACLRMTICPKEEKRCITVGTVSGTGKSFSLQAFHQQMQL
uniref:Snake toxin/toxin-like domain-containing protein n=1 Tax=Anolis carolinensis TaxID=28377 RepID=H9G4X2_ANOCA